MDELAAAAAEDAAAQAVPLVVLSGFLGAGKTTLLRHVLEQAGAERRVGVVVNDVAAVNVDADLVRRVTRDKDNVTTVHMENGCACCSASDDLFKAVQQLTRREGGFDVVVVECSGVAEPKRLWAGLQVALEEEGMAQEVTLARLVTVVDASQFLKHLRTDRRAAEPTAATAPAATAPAATAPAGQPAPSETARFVADLMAEQLESADLVVINKVDLLKKEGSAEVERLVAAMCPAAAVRVSEFGRVPAAEVFAPGGAPALLASQVAGPNSSNMAALSVEQEHRLLLGAQGTGSSAGSSALESEEPTRKRARPSTRVGSFVYRRRRPFDASRFGARFVDPKSRLAYLEDHVLRAKGYCWLANRMGMTMYLSQAGPFTSLVPLGAWWVEVPRHEWPSDTMPEDIAVDMQVPFGDRRQEIVFIGLELDEARITADLDACLVSEEELAELRDCGKHALFSA